MDRRRKNSQQSEKYGWKILDHNKGKYILTHMAYLKLEKQRKRKKMGLTMNEERKNCKGKGEILKVQEWFNKKNARLRCGEVC